MTRDQTREAAAVMLGFADGKEVQYRSALSDVWIDLNVRDTLPWDWTLFIYRLKPAATLRPWTADEVSLGAWFRTKLAPFRGMGYGIITYADDGGIPIHFGNGTHWVSFKEMLDTYEHSTDGGLTWKPCGVEEVGK